MKVIDRILETFCTIDRKKHILLTDGAGKTIDCNGLDIPERILVFLSESKITHVKEDAGVTYHAKDEVFGIPVKIKPISSRGYPVAGLIVTITYEADSQIELTDVINQVETKFIDRCNKSGIPMSRMCRAEELECVYDFT